ncbi:MAG: hypothetical protein IPP46_09150 [Bacteroidetes bacterium]|nr:hypothetical protein [Bacteroidota bacterium]
MTAVVGGGKTYAQFNNNTWVFGDSAGIHWQGVPKTPTNFKSIMKMRGASSTISDSSGLISYFFLLNNIFPLNNILVNKYNSVMSNGSALYGGGWYHDRLIIPNTSNDSMLYIFSAGVTASGPYGLYYSIANYKANNDSGIVIQKNVMLNNLPAFDALMAVRHGNGRDWWLIFQWWNAPNGTTVTNEYYIYLINETGINGPFNQSIGLDHTTGGGHLIFNNEGSKFAQISWKGQIQLCDFDRCSGLITSFTAIQPEGAGPFPLVLTSCAFSPNERFLYVCEASLSTQPSTIWQYDLTAANIVNSKVGVGVFNDPNMGVHSILLAPDEKIYISTFDENYAWPYPDTSTAFTTINSNLSVINQPDSLGLACDFQPFSFYLGGARTYYGLPNNPDYELGAWVGSPCDTLSVGVQDLEPPQQAFFQAWYNSEWNMIHVNASKLKGRTGSLRLFDMEGRLVFEKKGGGDSGRVCDGRDTDECGGEWGLSGQFNY